MIGIAAARTEEPIGQDGLIEVSHVRLASALPADFPAHPESLNYLSYLRFRHASGPADPAQADAILVIQPGNYGGPHSLDGIARSTVTAAAAKGRKIEFWALARRSENTDDPAGFIAALERGDPNVALDYYFGGAAVDGRSFAGFEAGADRCFLAELGFAQVIADTREVVLRELPDPALRREKLFLGGHSGGASLVGALGSWDFDGEPGHELCKGFIALDTPVDCDLGFRTNRFMRTAAAPMHALGGLLYPKVVAALRAGKIPGSSGRMVTEALYVTRLLGLYAHLTPDADATLLREILARTAGTPTGAAWRILVRLLRSATWRQALTGGPDPLDIPMTCAAEFGLWIGTGTAPHPGRIAVGELDGPVVPRTFPLPPVCWRIPLLRGPIGFLFGREPLVAPEDTRHRYGWRDRPGPRQSATLSRAAAAMTGVPRTSVEPHHTTRFQIDQFFALAGIRTGDLSAIRYEREMRSKPLVSVFETHVPLAPHLSVLNTGDARVIPHYSHDDIVFTSPRTDGSPEPISDHITDFLLRQTGINAERADGRRFRI